MVGVGQVIGKRYRILEKIGDGGMGIVYAAQDRLTNSRVALKCVHTLPEPASPARAVSSSRDSDFRLALAQEFKILASLRHPNIISVLDYGFTDRTPDDPQGRPYFTMDLLPDAEPITQAAQTLSIADRVWLLVQTLEALMYLHRRKVVHRDLKPSNILVSAGQVKVLDFGLSIVYDGRHRDGADELPMGTLLYLAPEVLQGHPSTVLADLYAFAVIAYELITGLFPYTLTDVTRLIHDILSLVPDASLMDVPAAMTTVIADLLAKSPAERKHTAAQVKRILLDCFPSMRTQDTRATQESFLQAAQFIGRDIEFGQLTAMLAQARDCRGSAWLIGGESGVGKSRLLEELRTVALVNGMTVLRGQAVVTGGSLYGLWQEIGRRLVLLGNPTDAEAAVLKSVVPDIETLLERSVADVDEIEPQAAQKRLLDTFQALLLRVLYEDQQSVLILLEDLHWAGSESAALLNALCNQLAEWPLMIVASYRDDEYSDLPAAFPQMNALKLPRLDEASIAALSASMLGDTQFLQDVVDLLQRETEGNVFFMVEVVRALAEDAGQLEKIGWVTLPKTVFGGGIELVVRRRLNQVPEDARPLLELAAVIGRQIDLALLAQLSPHTHLETWLTTCAACAVLEVGEAGGRNGEWRFAHDKLREGLLTALPPEKAAQLHRQVAEALENTLASPMQHANRLAYHWGQAGDPFKEFLYVGMAGQQAIRSSANREAIDYFARAHSLLLQLPAFEGKSGQEVELLIALGSATMAHNGYAASEVESIYRRARDISKRTEDAPRLIRVLTNLSGYYIGRAEYSIASDLGLELLLLSNDIGSPVGALWAHLILGQTLGFMGEYEAAQKHLNNVVKNYDPLLRGGVRRNAVQDFGVAAMAFLGVNRWILGYPDDALAWGERAIALAEQLDHPMSIVFATHWTGIIHFFRGEYAQCYERSQATLRLARSKNYGLFVAYAQMFEAFSQFYLGAPAEPLLMQVQRVIQQILATGADFTMPFTYSLVAEMQAQMNRLDEAAVTLNKAIQLMETCGEYWCASELFRHRGELLMRLGRDDREIEAAFRRSLGHAEERRARSFALRTALRLARLWQFQGRLAEAHGLLAPLLNQFTEGETTRDVRESRELLADKM